MIKKICEPIAINFYILFCVASLIVARGYNYPFIPLIKAIYIVYVTYILFHFGFVRNKALGMLKGCLVAILLSLVSFLLNPNAPFSLFTKGIELYFFPVGFFLIAQNFTQSQLDKFYKRTFYGFLFTYIVGLYLYIVQPDWYVIWRKAQLEELLGNSAQSYLDKFMNLSSFFSHPYFVGYTSIWTISYTLDKIRKSEKFPYMYMVMFAITFVASFLAQQRLCTVVNIATIFVYLYLEMRSKKYRLTYVVAIIVIITSMYIASMLSTFSVIFERYGSIISGDILNDGRDLQWRTVYKHFDNFITGEGFNLAGHGAEAYGLRSIADGEFFKFFYEIGIVGCLFFYGLWFKTINKIRSNITIYAIETPVIIGFVLAQYGANTFEMTNIIILFWFSAGVVWHRNTLEYHN